MAVKNRLLILGFLLIFSSSAYAERRYGSAGCGLGSAVMGRGGSQTSAATTNGSFNSQLFGITFGTSNCLSDSAMKTVMQQEAFMMMNYATLTKEMAKGEGNTLAGLAETLGCETQIVPVFGQFVQQHYSDIVAAPGSIAMLDTLKETMISDFKHSNKCAYVNIN